MLYDSGEDVDFALLEVSAWRQFASLPEARVTAERGYRVLYDELGLEAALEERDKARGHAAPDAAAFTELASDFWYHALWTAKKLRRGEVYTAISCLDGHMKARLVTLLEWHARAVDPGVDTWHGGRFLERWADPGALSALERAYRALRPSRRCASALGDDRPLAEARGGDRPPARLWWSSSTTLICRRRVAEVVRDPRHGATL